MAGDKPNRSVEKEVMDRLTDKPDLKESFLTADKIIPYPKEFADQDKLAEEARKAGLGLSVVKDGYNNGGYEWCIKNWGTKWDFSDVERVITQRACKYWFRTAWLPPRPLIEKLSEMFPELIFTLKYWECGAGYSGKLVLAGDEIICDEYNSEYRGRRGG